MKKIITWFSLTMVSALMCMAFVACTPSSLEKADKKLSAEGYDVQTVEVDKGGTLIATDFSDKTEPEALYAVLFESKKDAKAYYDKLKSTRVMIEGIKEILEVDSVSSPIQKGKWVYLGTPDAIEDFAD